MKLPYFYLNLYEIGVSEYHLKIIWKNHRKSIKCSHTRSEWFHIFSTDEGIASISYNPAVYVYEIFIYSSYTFIYFATVWGGRGWYFKHFVKFWIWVYSRFSCKWPLKLLNKRPRLKHKNWCKSVICWPILMKFCVQPPIRHLFALANFQLGRKGQRPKGRKVKRPNFQKLSEAFLIKSKVVPDVFMSIFKLKGPISRNFALELIVRLRAKLPEVKQAVSFTGIWKNLLYFSCYYESHID